MTVSTRPSRHTRPNVSVIMGADYSKEAKNSFKVRFSVDSVCLTVACARYNQHSFQGVRGVIEQPLRYIRRHPAVRAARNEEDWCVFITLQHGLYVPLIGINSHANVVLAPVLHEGSLVAAFGVISRGADPPSMTALEHIRWCALEAGPPLARMRELEMLRNETRQFRQLAEQLAAAERVIHGLNEEAAQLNARSAMRANLQSNVAHGTLGRRRLTPGESTNTSSSLRMSASSWLLNTPGSCADSHTRRSSGGRNSMEKRWIWWNCMSTIHYGIGAWDRLC